MRRSLSLSLILRSFVNRRGTYDLQQQSLIQPILTYSSSSKTNQAFKFYLKFSSACGTTLFIYLRVFTFGSPRFRLSQPRIYRTSLLGCFSIYKSYTQSSRSYTDTYRQPLRIFRALLLNSDQNLESPSFLQDQRKEGQSLLMSLFPVSIQRSITPRAQTSLLLEYLVSKQASGLMQAGEPTLQNCAGFQELMIYENPKSPIFGTFPFKNILFIFRSRWMKPALATAPQPSAI